jgi:hypothetical protein
MLDLNGRFLLAYLFGETGKTPRTSGENNDHEAESGLRQ